MGDHELLITRVIDAPREKVWKAWTDAEHIGEWFGPAGFTTTTKSMDARPGGKWTHVMIAPDGTEYNDEITYEEMVEPERLLLRFKATPEFDLKGFTAEVLFEDIGGKTKITLHHMFEDAAELEKQKKIGAEEGGREMLEKLSAYLASH
jgi:uncharacterized protein YndB with AHSA1/START domain